MSTDTNLSAPSSLRPESMEERSGHFPVTGIGASAGGLEACIDLLSALPPRTGMAFVLVQHLEPHHESHLAEILSRSTAMPVLQVEDGMEAERDHVYVVPPNSMLTIKNGILRLSPRSESSNQYYPINHFFVSLAEDQGTSAIGVILSGSASDGAQGLRAIKCAAGTTLCQDEASAKYGGMPHSAIATGIVDFVLPPREIAAELARIGSHPYVTSGIESAEDIAEFSRSQADIKTILSLVRNATKVDFSQYKQNTIRRRIARRMLVHNLPSPLDYLNYLNSHPAELDDLYRDILICVTQFFRDPAMYEGLGRALAVLLPKCDQNIPFRIWVAGCATGEEAYSLAIVVSEAIALTGLPISIQLFGTDISDSAIDRARAGVYPEAIQQEVSSVRLSKFFTRTDAGYQISRSIRESCIFARHDLTRDPPFSQLNLVSCRNLLIYLGNTAQQKVLQALHYSLRPDGLLVLGSAESLGNRTDLFTALDGDNKIFRKRFSPGRSTVTLPDPQSADNTSQTPAATDPGGASPPLAQIENRATRILRDLYAPPGVTVNDAMQILHFHGQTSLYLEPPSGEASLSLFRVAHQSLVFALRKAVDTAAARNSAVHEDGIRFDRGGNIREITIRVVPITELGMRYYLILFEDRGVRQKPAALAGATPATEGVDGQGQPESRELSETREYLRKVIDQHEVAIEELRAAHEEVQSSNEEMQSSNEELRTAKEELQSSNEELITVNEELKNLNEALGAANNDLTNVLNAVNIPIVMVGMDLRVRRFTPAADRLLNTVASDIGRLISDVHYTVQVPGMAAMLLAALETLTVQQTTAQNREGRWYSVTVRPYRTTDDRIDGAVITFIDIDDVTRALERAEAARDFAEGMVETIQHPLLVLDHELRVRRATSAFYKTFHVAPEETQGQKLFSLGDGQWNIPRLRTLLEEALMRDVPFRDLDVDHSFPEIGHRTMRLNGRRISGRDRQFHTILLAIEDVTERKEAAEIQYRRIFESAKDGIVVLDGTSGHITDVNPYFLELTRYPREELLGRSFWEIAPFRKAEEGRRLMPEVLEKGIARYDSVRLQAQDGRFLIVEMVANCYRVRELVLVQVNIRDVTQRRQAEEDLRRSNLDLQQFAFAASHDLQEPLRTVINQVQLLQKQYQSKLGPEADIMIDFITSASDRMRQMVLDLLSYAQTARADIVIAPVNVEGVLAMALANLQLAIENTGARVTFDHLPTVLMDQTQLLQLLQNLIGNALKYRGPEPPRIHLSAQAAGKEWRFCVEDNGLGIDPQYHEHIFTVFKRLHGPEYPGTGIGLATCKRIIERHGGRIWVESEPGKGAKFFFTARAAGEEPE